MSKRRNGQYQTMSKFGRINLERQMVGIGNVDNVEDVLQDIKHLNDRPIHRMSVASSIAVAQRLLSERVGGSIKTRSRYLPRKKPKRNIPQVRKYVKPEGAEPELPGSAQYTPNFNVCLPNAPHYVISGSEKEVRMNLGQKTQSEMMAAWQRGIRGIQFDMEPVGPSPKEEPSEKETENPSRPETTMQGIISGPCNRDSFMPPQDLPAPGQYKINRSLDKSRVISFDRQATRKEMETLPDRYHPNLAQSIDATKGRTKGGISFDKQLGRERHEAKKDDIWVEIEKEQKALLKVLHPPEKEIVTSRKTIEPFSRQTSVFGRNPFESFMGPAETRDLQYDVDASLKALQESRKIQPMSNFGRRVNDCDRAIYAKSEAPDVLYEGVRDEWANAHPCGATPLFKNMHDRKSAYDYMPKTCGGETYTFVENGTWSYRTPVVMDKMGERKLIIEVPPQFTQKRATSHIAGRFA